MAAIEGAPGSSESNTPAARTRGGHWQLYEGWGRAHTRGTRLCPLCETASIYLSSFYVSSVKNQHIVLHSVSRCLSDCHNVLSCQRFAPGPSCPLCESRREQRHPGAQHPDAAAQLVQLRDPVAGNSSLGSAGNTPISILELV